MEKDTFPCPQCQFDIELTGALKSQLTSHVKSELKQEHQEEIGRISKKLEIAQKKQADAEKKERELQEKERELNLEVQKKVSEQIDDEKNKLEQQYIYQVETAKKETANSLQKEFERKTKERDERDIEKKKEFDELEEKLEIAQKKQADAEKKERELQEKERELNLEVQKKVSEQIDSEKNKLEQQYSDRVESEKKKTQDWLLKEFETRRAVERQKDKEKYKEEFFELEKSKIKAEGELQDMKNRIELETLKAVNEAEGNLQQKYRKEKEEYDVKYRLKIAEKDKTVEQLKQQIESLQDTVNKTSQELQGEIWEQDVEQFLKTKFPQDSITEIKRGVSGADVVQQVWDRESSRSAGKILWEMKNTKNFTQGWIAKLKDDQRSEKADIAILATMAMPDDIDAFGLMDGVFVCSPAYLYPVTVMLRGQLIEINKVKISRQGRDDKIAQMYDYLNSDQFSNWAKTIIDKSSAMRDELVREQRATKVRWSKQTKNIEMMETAIAGMLGDMKSIAGNDIESITNATRSLEYDEIDDDEQE